jgi:hypothetical protein
MMSNLLGAVNRVEERNVPVLQKLELRIHFNDCGVEDTRVLKQSKL